VAGLIEWEADTEVYNMEAGALVKELAVNISAFQAGVIPPPLAVVIDFFPISVYAHGMKDFKPHNSFGGGGRGGNLEGDRGGFRGGNKFGKRDFVPKEMFDAVCAECGRPCQVPFRPNGERPVYCRDCFAKVKPPNQDQPRSYERPDAPRRELSASSATRQEGGDAQSKQIQELKRQLDIVNMKLDRLLARGESLQKETVAVVSKPTESPKKSVIAKKSIAKRLKTKKK